MSTIDQRVVSMKFDNAQFEQGVKTTTKSLDDLNKGLKLEGATKGLTDIASAAKSFTLSHISDAVDGISQKFSAMSIIGITALTNIVNKAVNAGEQMVKSLTLDPINAGFQEYELKMGSIQTILANTARYGTSLDQVNKSLDELNTYADKTIYNFGDMTKNIGLFTNAGIRVEDATSMIKGFSNAAAASGTSAQGAAGAAYQLSQALSSGKVTLMDWRSLTNVGMGNKNMQDGIIAIASAMGTFKGKGVEAKDAQKDFNATLEKGWLTTDVMSSYLKIMAGEMDSAKMKSLGLSDATIKTFQEQAATAQDAATKVRTFTQLIGTMREAVGSGWSETFGILFGNFDEATVLFTNVNNVLGGFVSSMSDARNKVLGDWKALGGRTVLIEAISNAFNALIAVVKPIKDAFREVFPATTAKQLYDMTVAIRDFTTKLKIGGTTANEIKRTFAGVFAIFDIGWQVVKQLAKVFFDLFGITLSGSGGILKFTARIGDWLLKVDRAVKKGDEFTNFFKKLEQYLSKPIVLLKEFGHWVASLFDGFDAKGSGKTVGDFFSNLVDKISGAGKKIGDFFSNLDLVKSITDKIKKMNWGDILGVINTGLFAGLGVSVGLLIKSLYDKIKGNGDGGGFFSSIKESFNQLTDTLKTMQTALKVATLLEIAAAIGILTISVVALSKIDAGALSNALTAITIMFVQLFGAMAVFEKYMKDNDFRKMAEAAAVMILMSIAIDILASAVKKLADLDWNGLAKGLTGLTVILAALIATVKLMPDDKKMISSSIGIAILAGAVKLLVWSMKDFAGMSWEELGKGLAGLAGTLVSLGLFTKFADADKAGLSSGAGILLIGVAIKLIASAMVDIAKLSWDQIEKGLVGLASAMAMVVGSLKLIPESSFLSGGGMAMVSLGLGDIASALAKVGKMSWDEILHGVVALDLALASIASAMEVLPPSSIAGAAGILIVAMSLGKVGDFLQQMSKLSWEEIGKAMVVLFGTLLLIASGIAAMEEGLPGAAAMIVVAAALQIMLPVLQAFGQMSWEEIGKGLTMLAGVFLVLGIAGLVLAPVVPFILLLGIAIGILGIAMLAAGVGVLAFAVGLTLLSMLGKEATDNIVNIVQSLIGLIPLVMQKIGEGVILFAMIIANAGPAITMAITTVLLSLINAIEILAPKIVNTLFKLLVMMLNALAAYVPLMVDAGLRLLTGILNGIAKNIDGIVTAATNIIVNFLNALGKNLPRIVQAGVDLIINFVNGLAEAIRNNSARMGEAGGNLASAMVEGMVKGLGAAGGKIASKAKEVALSAWNAAKEALGINSPSKKFIEIGMGVNEGFAKGLDKYSHLTAKSAEGVGVTALDVVRKSLSGLSNLGIGEMDLNPTITPVLDLSEIKKGAGQMGDIFTANPLAVQRVYDQTKAASADYQSNQTFAEAKSSGGDTNLNYTQINNSPKALSSADIYRSTKNQLSVAKGALASSAN